MDEMETKAGIGQSARAWLGGIAPVPRAAAIASMLAILLVAAMPIGWIGSLSWNLYLDRIGPWFEPPVGGAGRLAFAALAALVAGTIAALAMSLKQSATGDDGEDLEADASADQDQETSRRRRIDHHPDAPPRPVIRAASDLPAEGLGPLSYAAADTQSATAIFDADPIAEEDAQFGSDDGSDGPDDDDDDFLDLSLADMAPVVDAPPISAEVTAVMDASAPAPLAMPAGNLSLGAMVERFEAGLARRRQAHAADRNAANEDGDPVIDFALEAALSTLQRMNRRAVG